MQLNEKQLEAYNEVLNGEARVVVILGKAGSGKTTVISEIVKVYKGEVLVTATTHKAKSILEKLLQRTCYTIHSVAGFNAIRNGIEEYFIQVRDPIESDLLVVDEFSMMTEDVLKSILSANYKKIVLVGDQSQLPAIGLRAKIPSEAKIITLSQNMRQGENEELNNYLDKLREHIFNKKMFSVTTSVCPDFIKLYDKHKDFCKAYLEAEPTKRILAYSNRVVDSYNLNVNKGVRFQIGDLLIIDKPLKSARNGDMVEVTDISDKGDFVALGVSFEAELSKIYVFKSKAKEEAYLKDSATNDEYWAKKDLIYHPKQIYATTIHKAQGQTIDEVFIDLRDIYAQLFRTPSKYNNYNKPISIDEYLKLLYVAITRMRYKAHLFIGEKRDYKHLRKEVK